MPPPFHFCILFDNRKFALQHHLSAFSIYFAAESRHGRTRRNQGDKVEGWRHISRLPQVYSPHFHVQNCSYRRGRLRQRCRRLL